MKNFGTMKTAVAAATVAYLAATAAAATATSSSTSMGVEQPSSNPVPMQPIVQGCFSSVGNLTFHSNEQYNSRGQCGQVICQALGKTVAATTEGSKCYCGDAYPPKNSLVDDKNCNIPCTGFGTDACGGLGYWTIYNTGLVLYGIPYAPSESSSSSSSSSTPTSTTTSAGQTVFVTQTPTDVASTTPSAEPSSKSSTNTGGIVAGVVVAVVVVAAAVGGVFFFLRRRRNKEIEEEHRRNAAVNAFINGSKPGSSAGYSASGDSRLDPVMAQRRMSSGSIADNQDYSRRILRVTNA